MRRSEKKYRELLETANSIILCWNPDGTLRFINDYGLLFFGYTREEMIGRSVQMLVPERDSQTGADLTRLSEEIARNITTYRHSENENITKHGERRWVMWTNKAILDAEGNIEEILAIGNDITELKKAGEVLRRDKELLERMANERSKELLDAHIQLERSRRMSDIGRLSTTIAHELRNPLSAIQIAAYNIDRKARNPLLDKHLETINRKVLESDHIIQNLLSFTRIKTASIEKLDICELVRECVAAISTKYAGWNVDMKERFDCDEGSVISADRIQMKMLFSNLLDNAYQALKDESGKITVTAQKHRQRSWEISITDNGAGIAEQAKEKLFEPFYTTKTKGVGLGLAICREIVDMHCGKIEVQSSEGKETTFTVTLPVRRLITLPAVQLPGQPAESV